MGFSVYMKYVALTLLVAFLSRTAVTGPFFPKNDTENKRGLVKKADCPDKLHKIFAKKEDRIPKLIRKYRRKCLQVEVAQIAELTIKKLCICNALSLPHVKNNYAFCLDYDQPERGPPIA